MLGVRLTFLGPAQAWLTDGTPDWFWPEAEKAGLPVMFLTPGRNAELARVAERHPRLQLIADHMGVGGDTMKEGRHCGRDRQTASLAKYPNVSVKLSAAPNYSVGGLSVPRFHAAHQTAVRCLWSEAMLLGHRHDQRLRQGHL